MRENNLAMDGGILSRAGLALHVTARRSDGGGVQEPFKPTSTPAGHMPVSLVFGVGIGVPWALGAKARLCRSPLQGRDKLMVPRHLPVFYRCLS